MAPAALHTPGTTHVPRLKVQKLMAESSQTLSHTPEIVLIRKAERFYGFCCYQFPPVAAAAIFQTLKFTVRLAADRNTPFVRRMTLTCVPTVPSLVISAHFKSCL